MEYRFDFALELFFDVVSFSVLLMIWHYVYRGTPQIMGFSFYELMTYYFLVYMMRILMFGNLPNNLSNSIRKGDLAQVLIKPISVPMIHYITRLAPALVKFCLYSIIVSLFLLFTHVFIPPQFNWFAFFVMSLFFVYTLNFFIGFIVGCFGFWILNTRGLSWIIREIIGFLSGGYFPIVFFPETVQKILSYTPLFYLKNFPAMIYLGRVNYNDIFQGIIIQIAWLMFFFVITRALWKKGVRKFESVGI